MFRVIIKLCGVIWSNAILLLHVYVKDNVIHSLSCSSLKEDGTMASCSSGSNSGKSERRRICSPVDLYSMYSIY